MGPVLIKALFLLHFLSLSEVQGSDGALGQSYVSEQQKVDALYLPRRFKTFAYRATAAQIETIHAAQDILSDALQASRGILNYDLSSPEGKELIKKLRDSPVWIFTNSCPLCSQKDRSKFGVVSQSKNGQYHGALLLRHCLFTSRGCSANSSPTDIKQDLLEQIIRASLDYYRRLLIPAAELEGIYASWLKSHENYAKILSRKAHLFQKNDREFLLHTSLMLDSDPIRNQCLMLYFSAYQNTLKYEACRQVFDLRALEVILDKQILQSTIPAYGCSSKCALLTKIDMQQAWPELVQFNQTWAGLLPNQSCEGSEPLHLPEFIGHSIGYFIKNEIKRDRSADPLVKRCIENLLGDGYKNILKQRKWIPEVTKKTTPEIEVELEQ